MSQISEQLIKREWPVFLLIVAAALLVYGKALSFGFQITWDDPSYVVDNAVAHGFSWAHVKAAFTRFFVGNYAPLHIVSYMLDYTLWGLNPAGYTCHNIILHALNGCLLYHLLRRLSTALYPAILAALLFVVHPVQVESVLWISQRKNVLAMFFFLLAIHFYSKYLSAFGGARKREYFLVLLFFTAALLVKSVAVVLPLTLLLYDVCLSERKLRQSILDKLPFILLAAVASFVALLSQSHEYGGGGRTVFHGGGVWSTLLTMLPVAVSYLKMVIYPSDLSIVYAPQIRTGIDAEVVFAICLLCSLAAVGYWLFKRSKTAFFWYASIPVALLPVAQLVPLVTLMNDRYLYFPMVGVAACFGLAAQQLLSKVKLSWRGSFSLLLFLLVALYGSASFQRGDVWRNSLVLWQDAAEKQPGSAVAWLMLGDVNDRQGDPAAALTSFERAREICQGVECFLAYKKLSILNFTAGNSARAEESADQLIRLFPRNAYGYVTKGYLKYQQGELLQAEKFFLEAVRFDSAQQAALIALGNIYLATGRPAVASEKLKAAEKLGNPTAELYFSLACAEASRNNRQEALNYLDQALRLGYNKQGLIMKSPELSSLRDEPGFVRLMQSYFHQK